MEMEMEMEMRASEDIEIGGDIIEPLSPISFALFDSFLHSHCSCCFSPLLNPSSSPSFLYCSPLCSSLHFSSSQLYLLHSLSSSSPPLSNTSDLRAALCLLDSLLLPHSSRDGRFSGLLTNRQKFVTDNETFRELRYGARAIAAARRLRAGNGNLDVIRQNEDVSLEEAALCSVLTNAVEVRNSKGQSLGIAVYDHTFSWINHSCSPNAWYRFLISPPNAQPCQPESRHRIVPKASNGENSSYSNTEFPKGHGGYGPMIIVRSIKRIKKGEEVTLSYIDLLKPREIRQSELLSSYHFSCSCTRCNDSPPSYVDQMLQEITAANPASSSSCFDENFCRDVANRNLTGYVDEIISEYLSVGDPESCCSKLESVLVHGLVGKPLEMNDVKSQFTVKLHPLHHLALTSYMSLGSAYRVRASEVLALSSDVNTSQLEVFSMLGTGAAYSFLLAAATHHLFCFESSLVAPVADFWKSAGESLLTLARSSLWNLFSEWELPGSKHFSVAELRCSNCSLLEKFEVNFSNDQGLNKDFGNISSEFLDCITSISREVWSFLSQDCHYLKLFKDPFDLDLSGKLSNMSETSGCSDGHETKEYTRLAIFQLGVHCLLYAECLAIICIGTNCDRTTHIQNLLYCPHEKK